MTLLDTIKSLLGLGDSRESSDREERFGESDSETAEPATDSETAVKGTDESTADETGGRDEPAAAGGDAADSTDSMTEEDSSDTAAEPGEAAGPKHEDDFEFDNDKTEATDSTAVGVDDTAEESAAAGGDAAGSTGSITEETGDSISAAEDAEAVGPTGEEPTGDTADHAVDVLKGIGPSYSERLGEAGVETVADLAEADSEKLAEETDISANRIGRWIERAKARRQ